MNKIFYPIAAGMTDIGLVRRTNQDSYLIDQNLGLFIVADGMGGHAGGEVASSFCVNLIQKKLKKNLFSSLGRKTNSKVKRLIDEAVNYASGYIYDKALEEPQLKGMGTTATILTSYGEYGYFGHVGDSRLYLLRNGFMYQLTKDHSLISEKIHAGQLTIEEAKNHCLKNVITRSVGFQAQEYVDVESFLLRDKDIFILTSDGLHGKLNDNEISTIVKKERLDAIDKLVDLAKDRGGEDNISVVIVEFQSQI